MAERTEAAGYTPSRPLQNQIQRRPPRCARERRGQRSPLRRQDRKAKAPAQKAAATTAVQGDGARVNGEADAVRSAGVRVICFRQGDLTCFEQRLEIRENLGPASGNGLNEF
jgi:hypothetical protein